MSKTCPNCGVNSPDNAKFCIECAYDIEEVPINEKENKTSESTEDEGSNTENSGEKSGLSCIIMIAIVVIIIVTVGFFIFGSGSGESSNQNITLTFDEVKVSDFISSNDGKTVYSYSVTGYFSNLPDDIEKYMVKTIYYDSNGNELTSTTEKLSQFKDDLKYNFASTISFYQTNNYLDVDHVSVQILKDNILIQEFNSTVNSNKLTSISSNTSNLTNNSVV